MIDKKEFQITVDGVRIFQHVIVAIFVWYFSSKVDIVPYQIKTYGVQTFCPIQKVTLHICGKAIEVNNLSITKAVKKSTTWPHDPGIVSAVLGNIFYLGPDVTAIVYHCKIVNSVWQQLRQLSSMIAN